MKKTLFIVLTLLAALLVCVSCDNSLDADVFTPDPTPETDPNKMPLTLEFIEAGELTIIVTAPSIYGDMDVYYAINGGEKTLYSAPVSAAAGDKVTLYRTLESAKVSYPYITIGCSKDCYVYGNVMSLIDPDNYATKTEVVARAFLGLFADNTHIKNHESIDLVLPATTLAERCYAGMFDGCTGLTKAPILPATTLKDYCYYTMFQGCTNLKEITCLATNITATNCLQYWMYNAGLAAETKEFHCKTGSTIWISGTNVPADWTIVADK